MAIDPGIRTFATCYDQNGTVTEWGKNCYHRIFRLSKMYDKIQSRC